MKILVTSFKPFNNEQINYSNKVMDFIMADTKILLDVIYDDSYNELNKQCNLDEYNLIIALGEARKRDDLTLETTAKNISSATIADNKGILLENKTIIQNGSLILKTKVDYSYFLDYIKLSNDAGTFVCNNLYYYLLTHYPEKSLFIHIPNCNDLEEEYMKHAININKIIEIFISKTTILQ